MAGRVSPSRRAMGDVRGLHWTRPRSSWCAPCVLMPRVRPPMLKHGGARWACPPWGRRPHGDSVAPQQQQRGTTFRGAFSSMHSIVRRAGSRRAAGTPLTRRSCRVGLCGHGRAQRTAGEQQVPTPVCVAHRWHRGPLGGSCVILGSNASFWAQMRPGKKHSISAQN